MRRLVIDASTTLGWLFDEDSGAARVRRVLDESELVAPWLWRLEVTNAILVRERRKAITVSQSAKLLSLIDELEIELAGEPATRSATGLAHVARPYHLSAYDAAYLDLAIRMDLPLYTRDKNLRSAAGRAGVELVAD